MPLKRAAKSIVKLVAIAAVGAAIGVVAFQAGKRAIDTAPPAPPKAAATVVTLGEGTLVDTGSALVSARWVPTASVRHRRSGTVTASSLPSGVRTVIDSGTVLFSVDGRAVIAVRGAVPAFRAMGPTMAGDDIAQFQQFLADLGLLTAPVDGKWGTATTAATRVWQDLAHLPRSATVEFGSIVYLPTLPTTVTSDPTLVVGAIADEGTVAFQQLAAVPRFAAIVSPDSTESITGGLRVEADVGGTALEFTTAETQTVDEAGVITVDLEPVAAAVECGSWCDAIVTGRATQVSGIVTRAGPLDGVVVPVGALRSGAGDELFVVAVGGAEMPVTVTLRVGANAIVEGVPAGTKIELPTAATAAPA